MVRILVELPEGLHNRLRELARSQGRSVADCIREGLDLFLAKYERQAGAIEAIAGKYRPQPTPD